MRMFLWALRIHLHQRPIPTELIIKIRALRHNRHDRRRPRLPLRGHNQHEIKNSKLAPINNQNPITSPNFQHREHERVPNGRPRIHLLLPHLLLHVVQNKITGQQRHRQGEY